MTQLRSTDDDGDGYGLGFWLTATPPALVGSDTGASFASVHLSGRVDLVGAGQHDRRRLAGGAAPRSSCCPVTGSASVLTRGSVLDAAPPGGA